MRLFSKFLVLLILAVLAWPAGRLGAESPTVVRAEQAAAHDTTAYTLSPEKMRKAVAITRIWNVYAPADTLWTLLQFLLILALGIAARMRDFAVGLSKYRWVQGPAFVFLFLLLSRLLSLPLDMYRHRLGIAYGFSVQHWGSWFGDQAKTFAIAWVLFSLMTMLLFWVMRKSPARWWFWFWIPAVLFGILGVFITPYVIDPLFNKFEPLAKSDPALVQQLEKVVARGGLAVPPERMFLMKASAKVTTLNAYVTGFGASKRVVVWDTTIAKATPDEISFIFGHEMGHYALGHILMGTAWSSLALLPTFWIGYHCFRLLLRRFGGAWGIPSQNDWAALIVFTLVLVALADLSEPVENSFHRMIEHNADIYGQEAMHGIVADPRTVGRQAFQVLGEESLDDPTPHPLVEFWTYTHPPIRTRAGFAVAYDPWAPGEQPKYFAK